MRFLLLGLSALFFSFSVMAQKVPPPADPGTANFKWVEAAIFASKCVTCHGSFSTYDGLKREMVPGHPENSPLYLAMGDGTDCQMPQSLNNAPIKCVGTRGLRAVYWWIRAGANPNSN